MDMEPGKLVIAISLAGVGVLYCIATVVNPPHVPLDSIANHNNELVKTGGIVTALRHSGSGNTIVEITANGTSLPVFVRSSSGLDLRYGDEIELEGRVYRYRDNYAITTAGENIRKINSSSDIYFVAEIAGQPDAYRGRRIRVIGNLSKVYTNVFYLDRMRVVVTGAKRMPRVEEGDRLVADGVLVYNTDELRYELKLISLSYPQASQYSPQ